ncbi:MAG TPA: type III-A CRISPR-associated protein Csm2 [Giesbergeria sp.]|nr:type III-A CRISPR-associated protein Csm2 [Giesbergeria sp.]HRA13691.1 type III-A CRISPR-associated protein Csm2 [Giesbergeria sp.]
MATQYQSNQGWANRPRQDAPRITLTTADIRLKDIPATLFSDIAQEKAATVFQAGEGKKNKSTQLRRFYDELVMWYERVQFERTPAERATKYKELAPFIQMLVAKVAYAKGREHVDECFETLFAHLVRQISDADSLRHAKLFMEAFMGFYKAQEK